MRLPLPRSLLLVVLLATAASSCSDTINVTTPTPPTVTPVPPSVRVTDTFSGSLTTGAVNYYTVTARVGAVVTTMTGIGPDPTVPIGLSVGVLSTLTCTALMTNPAATIGNSLTATASGATTVCVTVYDPGTVPADTTVTYALTVTHY